VTRYDLADDDVLLDLLAQALGDADPVPGEAVAAAKAVASLSDVDAELATLVADTVLDSEVVLFRHDVTMQAVGGATDRLVSFTTAALEVDIELQDDGRSLMGALTPPLSADVEFETAAGRASTRSDDLGRFRLTALPPGPCRLRIHALGGAVVTPWITR
jgi:hypothetical protein